MVVLYRTTVFSVLLLSTQALWACMPHSPNDVFIGRFQASLPVHTQGDTALFQLQFSHPRFVFRTLKARLLYSNPEQWQSTFALKGINPNDLMIGLAYAPSSNEPTTYRAASLAALHCQDDVLSLGKPLVPFLAWDRDGGRCRTDSHNVVGILDGFIEQDQAAYLQQLQIKYPTCAQLYAAFPSDIDENDLQAAAQPKGSEKQDHQQPPSFWYTVKLWLTQWLS